ncbi:hypothetical protein [Gracilibacillus alcaliphilus]|nr:hypothetical protein [Gracilibacillus alcaliphilus]MBM7676271.1 hypothetical protein [Gracilibacillus alcaliphilus]
MNTSISFSQTADLLPSVFHSDLDNLQPTDDKFLKMKAFLLDFLANFC